MPQRFLLDPNAVLDFTIDWGAKWLVAGDTLTTSTMTADPGLTVTTDTMTTTKTTVWVTGGTVGTTYAVRNHVTTAQGRQTDATIYFQIQES